MTDVARMELLVGLALAGGSLIAADAAAHAQTAAFSLQTLNKHTDIACVYHCDFGNAVYDYDPFRTLYQAGPVRVSQPWRSCRQRALAISGLVDGWSVRSCRASNPDMGDH